MSYLKFEELKSFGIPFLKVTNKRKEFLGLIEFEPAWEQYSFNPQMDTGFSIECLSEIVKKLNQINIEWKRS